MEIEIQKVDESEKHVLDRLLQLYLYEFSVFEDSDVNSDGVFEYEYFDEYWEDDDRHPFFIKCDGELVGFALVMTSRPSWLFDEKTIHTITEFFVMRKYRRTGVGKFASFKIFDEFDGEWEIWQLDKNIDAKKFWRAVIDEYTDGQWFERWGEKGPIQYFECKR